MIVCNPTYAWSTGASKNVVGSWSIALANVFPELFHDPAVPKVIAQWRLEAIALIPMRLPSDRL